MRVASFVCRRWRALCQHPALLQRIQCRGQAMSAEVTAQRLASLHQLLLRHSAHVRSLSVHVSLNASTADTLKHELAATLCGCLALSASAGQLTQLDLVFNIGAHPMPAGTLVASMTGLQHARFGGDVQLGASLTALTGLQLLALNGRHGIEPASSLPPSLAELCLSGQAGFEPTIPRQASCRQQHCLWRECGPGGAGPWGRAFCITVTAPWWGMRMKGSGCTTAIPGCTNGPTFRMLGLPAN